MKIRQGFVSNSSSTSFTVLKKDLTLQQVDLLLRHRQLAPIMFPMTFAWPSEWSVHDDGKQITGSISESDWPMWDYMKAIGIDVDGDRGRKKVEWYSW